MEMAMFCLFLLPVYQALSRRPQLLCLGVAKPLVRLLANTSRARPRRLQKRARCRREDTGVYRPLGKQGTLREIVTLVNFFPGRTPDVRLPGPSTRDPTKRYLRAMF